MHDKHRRSQTPEHPVTAYPHALTAASIAMAKSSGEQYATCTVGERGYWQINPDYGALSAHEPLGNARAAAIIIISADGTDWTLDHLHQRRLPGRC